MILKLLAVNLRSLVAATIARTGKGGKKRGTGTMVLFGILFLYAAAAFVFLFGSMFFGMRDAYFSLGLGWMYFAMAALFIFFLCVMTCIFQAQAQVFNARDNELLLAMPIRPSAIITARILTMLVVEYAFAFLVAGPAFVLWLSGGYGSVLGVVFFVLGFFLVPLLALAVACLLAWLISLVTSRMRRKNIVTLIIAIGFFAAYFYFVGNISDYMNSLMTLGADFAEAFRRAVFPAYHFGVAVADGNIVSFLLFAASALIPFVAVIALLSAGFAKIVTRNRGAKRVEYRARELKAAGAPVALLKKELARYISKPMIVLNMSMGSVLAVFAMVYFIVQRGVLMDSFAEFAEIMPGASVPLIANVIAMLALVFCASMSPASASLISLEGKTLWIARSMPVRGRDALLAKVNMHLVVSGVPVLIASVIAAIGTADSVAGAVMTLITPPLFVILCALFGLIFNLLHPKFDWVNEMQPVKQGMPIVVTMFGSMAVLVGLALLYMLLLSPFMSIITFVFIADAVIIGICVLLWRWLVTSGERRWDALEN